MVVTLKFKPLWQFIGAIGSLSGLYLVLKAMFSHGSPSLYELTVFVSGLVMTIMFVFIAPTARVILDDEGFLHHVGVGLFLYEFFSLKNKRFSWDQVTNVLTLTPKWWPIRIIIVAFSDGLQTKLFPLGTCVSNTSAGLRLLSKYVDKEKIDDDVLILIEKALANQ